MLILHLFIFNDKDEVDDDSSNVLESIPLYFNNGLISWFFKWYPSSWIFSKTQQKHFCILLDQISGSNSWISYTY